MVMRVIAIICVLAGQLWPALVSAQDVSLRYNNFGAPGLIEMPNARSAPDADLAFSLSRFSGQTRSTLTFQVSPRFSASFRYAALDDVLSPNGVVYDDVLDRSFSLRYRLSDETDFLPALAIGMDDFAGTGIYSAEYLVATKALSPNLSLTAGIGWGRLAGVGGFDNPLGARFADRSVQDVGQGGAVRQNNLFKGDAAFFGGIDWQMTDQVGVAAEYSSDALDYQDGGRFDRQSPVNIALNYAPRDNLQVSAQYLYGSTLGAQLTYVLNPTQPPFGGGLDPGPVPAVPLRALAPTDAAIARKLAQEGLRLHAISRYPGRISVEVVNLTCPAPAQAIGRTARVLAAHAPANLRQFDIALVAQGIAGPVLRLNRADLKAQEFTLQGAASLLNAAQINAQATRPKPQAQPVLEWGITPYITPNIFDPDNPLRADVGLALDALWSPVAGVVVAGTLRQRVAGNLDQATRMSDSVLPRVRSEFALYDREGGVDLIDLTAAWYAQPTPNVTTRLSVGLLEEMFGGASAELLWRPDESPLAFGIEVNHVWQRGFESDFSFRDYEVTTGHASVYWDVGARYRARIDAGRYLAGDWGATIALSRQFRNGWAVGAFATFTDVSFDDFGEGSFDKGITISVPVSWLSGRPSRDSVDRTIRPVTRDGGARLHVEGRLYHLTDDLGADAIRGSWGRVWR